MKILIGADIVPTETNENLFMQGDKLTLIGDELDNLLKSHQYRIFNLEVPLTNKTTPIKKSGPNLIAKTETVKAMVEMNIDLFTLANNHILDQGAQGLNSTIKTLKDNNISYLGAGENIHEAKKPFIIHENQKKIGIYACVEHEFSIAGENELGANPFDPLESLDDVFELKKHCDFVIVLYHGGKEHYRYPSPNLQKVCQKFIKKGADVVITQHSHCIGCMEKYQNGTIVYGQGNFLFDDSNSEFWKTSLLCSIDTETKDISFIPIVKNNNVVRLASEQQKNVILDGFNTRTEEIKDSKFVQLKYEEFANNAIVHYLMCSRGKRWTIGKVLNRLTKGKYYRFILKTKFNNSSFYTLYNYLECEAHYELYKTGIKNKLKK